MKKLRDVDIFDLGLLVKKCFTEIHLESGGDLYWIVMFIFNMKSVFRMAIFDYIQNKVVPIQVYSMEGYYGNNFESKPRTFPFANGKFYIELIGKPQSMFVNRPRALQFIDGNTLLY